MCAGNTHKWNPFVLNMLSLLITVTKSLWSGFTLAQASQCFPCVLTGLVRLNLLDVSGNLFSSAPRHLPPSVQQLYLSNNSFSSLDEDSFEGFLDLKYLRLSRCGLQSVSIHPQAFNHSSLVELDLSYNKLTTIPTVPTTLQYLYLEANKIKGDVLTLLKS